MDYTLERKVLVVDDSTPTPDDVKAACDRAALAYGMRLESVLLPSQWRVLRINGSWQVCVSENGVRALGMLSPAPNGPARAEHLIKFVRGSLDGK